MTTELRRLLAWLSVGLVLFGFGLPAMAQDSEAEPEEPVAEIDEVVVVTASRTEQKLHDVPASITVLTSEQVETMPADDYGDILRNVPGLNVSQIGTRDVNVSARQASGSLTTGQLVLIDGRPLYLDFFGFVIWEYLPVNTAEVKSIGAWVGYEVGRSAGQAGIARWVDDAQRERLEAFADGIADDHSRIERGCGVLHHDLQFAPQVAKR